MPLDTLRRPNRYRNSRRGLSGGVGGSEFGRAPGVLPLPSGGGNPGVVPPPAPPGPPPGTLLPPTASPNQTGWQTVPTLFAPGQPYAGQDPAQPITAQIPMPPFPGAVYAGGSGDMSVTFWQDPITKQIRTFNGGQELNSRPAAVVPGGGGTNPLTPPPAPSPTGTSTPASVNNPNVMFPGARPPAPQPAAPPTSPVTIPGSQFAGGVIPPWLQAALNGQAVAMADGGVIPEPVVGIGQISGRRYTFGEQGPETVVPGVGPNPTGDGSYAEGGTIGYADPYQGLSGFGQSGMLRLSPNDPDAPGLMAKYPGRYEYTSPAAAAPYLQQLANQGNPVGSMPQGYATPVAQPGSPAYSRTPPTQPISGGPWTPPPIGVQPIPMPIGGMRPTPPPPTSGGAPWTPTYPTTRPQEAFPGMVQRTPQGREQDYPGVNVGPGNVGSGVKQPTQPTLFRTNTGQTMVILPDGRSIPYDQWLALQMGSPTALSPAPIAGS